MVATISTMSELRTIRMNGGGVVVQPAARARYLVSRRLADWADEPEIIETVVPLDADKHTADVYGILDTVSYDQMTKTELVKMAEAMCVPSYGTKAQLIERMTDANLSTIAEAVGATTEDEPSVQVTDDGQS